MEKNSRKTYITNIDQEKALELFISELPACKDNHESIDTLDSVGRITYSSCYSKICSPFYNSSAMDGIAVYSKNTEAASEMNPLVLIEGKDFKYIDTGDMISDEYDAVIMIEDVINLGNKKVEIIKPAFPWQHIRPIGEDIIAGEMILKRNHRVRAIDLGALISGGVKKVEVYRKPKVGILPTGSELVENVDDMKDGMIIESNSRVIENLTIEYGGLPYRIDSVPDDYIKLKKAFLDGIAKNDILVVGAGTSAGTEDYTFKIIEEIGRVIVHGIGIRPGKPAVLGFINNKPVIGLPGYPVSSFVAFELFVKPLIFRFQGIGMDEIKKIDAVLTRRIVSSLKYKEYVRVGLGWVNDKLKATPIERGAGVTMSLVKADGILVIPRNMEGMERGENVSVNLLKPLESIKSALISLGSHDLIMDIVSDMMNLKSEHVGSMGGIMALKRGDSHIAPVHLLDAETGLYNTSFISKYFPDKKMVLVKGVRRMQGFIVQRDNPLKLKGFKDLVRDDIRYVNRQKGAGTRMLLDYNLEKENINPENISGYDREMTTHMAVGMSIKSGSSNVGLGIMSAAKNLGLDFIELGYEEYDFVFPYEFSDDVRIKEFLSLIKSKEFIGRVMGLGGYRTDNIGMQIEVHAQNRYRV